MTSRSLCAIALSTAACLSTPGPADPDAGIDVPTDTVTDTATDGPGACTDGDGDGWSTCGVYPDCADDDAARHPGAFEAVGGPDRDCFATAPTVAAPSLTHAAVGGDRVITGPVVVRLDDAAGGQLGSLIVGGTEMLYSGAVLERYSGVEAWDNTDPDNPSVNNARSIAAAGVVTALQLGRAVARLRVEWTASDITGASIYTVTPEGRVVRTDDFVLSNGGRFVSLPQANQAMRSPSSDTKLCMVTSPEWRRCGEGWRSPRHRSRPRRARPRCRRRSRAAACAARPVLPTA